ncbi:DUF2769 domain-containing protein [Methanosarcina sp.]|uniref:DUF2769 domain-containing protein n=1 Tax=Methanosarcina sp. TaxID=2213 RepID=UPI002ABA2B6D|nr:DUF2769 domain-containing protein [Methanosarcina sp.]MDY9927538.1 DUF2769 domain-containing protein [Methanosarcina sp.]
MYRGNILDKDSEILTEDRESTEVAEAEEFSEMSDIILRGRETYGRYFGICSSYHHLKACICKTCPSYPGGKGMFCARGGTDDGDRKGKDCLCEACELYKKFRLEGDYFCRPKEKMEVFERNRTPPNICTDFRTSAGTIRVCVLDSQK